jgi:hypothetical protein
LSPCSSQPGLFISLWTFFFDCGWDVLD